MAYKANRKASRRARIKHRVKTDLTPLARGMTGLPDAMTKQAKNPHNYSEIRESRFVEQATASQYREMDREWFETLDNTLIRSLGTGKAKPPKPGVASVMVSPDKC